VVSLVAGLLGSAYRTVDAHVYRLYNFPMDYLEQRAIHECRNCHRPEGDHYDADGEAAVIFNVIAGCPGFAVSEAALRKMKAQARAPKSAGMCRRCQGRGHDARNCPW
jgi:hypothetical protein